MTSGHYINYYCNQKDWWRNMDNVVRHYRHCSEENSMYLCHMSLPKQRIDRMNWFWMVK